LAVVLHASGGMTITCDRASPVQYAIAAAVAATARQRAHSEIVALPLIGMTSLPLARPERAF
jgi:hypothetical protein